MKKILLLGGSAQQIVAIETAKKLGYYTILCDFLPDNPGQNYADKFYLISTTDKEAILKIAFHEKIDGILAYASDPAAPTAAYVAEKMNLLGNPYKSVEILCNKDKFRKFLSDNNFNSPKSKGYNTSKNIMNDINDFCFPIIIKPVDSSGSKGITVLKSKNGLIEAIDFAFSFSRSHRIIVEEFVEKKHPYLIGGDIFIENGKIILWGLLNCHRDNSVNELVPTGKSYPLKLDQEDIENVKITLQKLVDKLQIRFGAMNVELIIDKKNKVWPVDIGPRNGGNMIPDLLGLIFNIDVVEMSIKTTMGEKIEKIVPIENYYYATYNLHSKKAGKFKDISYSDEIKPFILRECVYKKVGDSIEYFDNASKALGILFLKFNSMEEMIEKLEGINKWIDIKTY